VGGTSPAAASLVAIDQFYGPGRMLDGVYAFHPADFGLGHSEMDAPDSIEHVAATVQRICDQSDYIVLPDAIDEPTAYLFAYRDASLIRSAFVAAGCLGPEIATFNYDGLKQGVYQGRR
jgi:hypothetical protein